MKNNKKALSALGGLCMAGVAVAEEAPNPSVAGGITVVGQVVDGGRADPEANGSFDLIVEVPAGPGAWTLYVEGSTAPRPGGVPAVYPDANADAGTATADGEGTVQVSELKYRWTPAETRTLTAGVIDTSAYMDFSGTANDENSQFLNAVLVNNPTIEFPDYAPGLVYEQGFGAQGTWFGLVGSSHGIADNPNSSYTQLLDVGAEGKGVFGAVGARFAPADWSVEGGLWVNSADHTTLDGLHDGRSNYGAYAVIGAASARQAFDVRAGVADDSVSEAAAFGSFSYALRFAEQAVGMAIAYTQLADDAQAPGRDDSETLEFYYLFPVASTEVTADLQLLENPGFDATRPRAWIGSLRVRQMF